MKTTISSDLTGYTLKNPWNGQRLTFRSILQAISYCRNNGLVYSLIF